MRDALAIVGYYTIGCFVFGILLVLYTFLMEWLKK